MAVALVGPEPVHEQMRQRHALEGVGLAMLHPRREVDHAARLQPIHVVPVALGEEDHLISSANGRVDARDDVGRFAAGAQVVHEGDVIHL